MPRTYELKRRAERQAETRQRIIEATVALHEAVGLTKTTISAIAARAGVERLTVYRHFPDERALFTACTTHYQRRHPPPDPEPWRQVTDPEARLRVGLTATYAYHRRTERMMVSTGRDLAERPLLGEVLAPVFAHWRQVCDVLAAGWADDEYSTLATAAVGHVISFQTWHSLVREQGLDDAEAVALMTRMVVCGLSRPSSPG